MTSIHHFDEIKQVHPATEAWLVEHGYTYQHHVKMPEYGIADYIAKDSDGKILVVECKVDCHSIGKSGTQALDYAQQYGVPCDTALAIPHVTVTPKARNICKRRGIILIELDIEDCSQCNPVESKKTFEEQKPDNREPEIDYLEIEQNRIRGIFEFSWSLFEYPKHWADRVVNFYQSRTFLASSCLALSELVLIRHLVFQFYVKATVLHIFVLKRYLTQDDLDEVLNVYDDAIEHVAPYLSRPYDNLRDHISETPLIGRCLERAMAGKAIDASEIFQEL